MCEVIWRPLHLRARGQSSAGARTELRGRENGAPQPLKCRKSPPNLFLFGLVSCSRARLLSAVRVHSRRSSFDVPPGVSRFHEGPSSFSPGFRGSLSARAPPPPDSSRLVCSSSEMKQRINLNRSSVGAAPQPPFTCPVTPTWPQEQEQRCLSEWSSFSGRTDLIWQIKMIQEETSYLKVKHFMKFLFQLQRQQNIIFSFCLHSIRLESIFIFKWWISPRIWQHHFIHSHI